MLEGSGKALGFSPTTGGGKFCDLLAQPLTISSGSSKTSNTAFLLFSVGIGNLLLVTGVDFTLAEGFAGVIQGDTAALRLLRFIAALHISNQRVVAHALHLPRCAKGQSTSDGSSYDVCSKGDHFHHLHQLSHMARMIGFIADPFHTIRALLPCA